MLSSDVARCSLVFRLTVIDVLAEG